jgi:chromosome segregation ATPase
LKERLRAVLRDESVTEAELRKLSEEGRACELILGGQLQRSEQRLEGLSSDPNSSLAEIADALREVNELRPDLDELEALLGDLQARAREFRARWVVRP